MKIIVVDIQAFRLKSGLFMIKELCVYDGRHMDNYLFLPSIKFEDLSEDDKKTTRRLSLHHHGLEYSRGFILVEHLPKLLELLLYNADRVYVKGIDKYNLLLEYTASWKFQPCIINLENIPQRFPIPPKLEKNVPCKFHTYNTTSAVCAANNCRIIYNYILTLLPLTCMRLN